MRAAECSLSAKAVELARGELVRVLVCSAKKTPTSYNMAT
jgi:hypothetical protein